MDDKNFTKEQWREILSIANKLIKDENISEDEAFVMAEAKYAEIVKTNDLVKRSIPIAYEHVVKGDAFLEIMQKEVENICGYKPQKVHIQDYFLSKNKEIVKNVENDSTYQTIQNGTKREKLKITINGKVFHENNVTNTFLGVLEEIGLVRIQRFANENVRGIPLVALEQDSKLGKFQKYIAPFYIITNTSTSKKKEILKNIKNKLGWLWKYQVFMNNFMFEYSVIWNFVVYIVIL